MARQSSWLIIKLFPNPSSRDFWREKATYVWFFRAVAVAASVLFLSFPFLALANPFVWGDLFGLFGEKASAEGIVDTNSQRMALLDPSGNLDPSATGTPEMPIGQGSALEPQVGPSGTAADVTEMPQSSQISVYTVRSGDSLSQIAKMFGVSINTIIWANDIKGGVIHPGDALVILPVTGVRHTVVSGETLASLAKKYGGSPDEIAAFNGLAPGTALAAGGTVIIPDGEVQLVQSSSSSAGAEGTHKNTRIALTPSSHRAAIVRASRNEPYLGGSGSAIENFIWPLDGGQITQGLHGWNAVDIGAPRGTRIFAAAAGEVVVVRDNGSWNGGYGNYVVISEPDGTQTLYAHLSQVLTSAGASVSQGQTIGLVGATGQATGPHLHFEVRGAQNPFANLPLGSSE